MIFKTHLKHLKHRESELEAENEKFSLNKDMKISIDQNTPYTNSVSTNSTTCQHNHEVGDHHHHHNHHELSSPTGHLRTSSSSENEHDDPSLYAIHVNKGKLFYFFLKNIFILLIGSNR
jgi:hypothetical protein